MQHFNRDSSGKFTKKYFTKKNSKNSVKVKEREDVPGIGKDAFKTAADILAEHTRDAERRKLKSERETLIESLKLAEERISVYESISQKPRAFVSKNKIKRTERSSGLREATAVLMCSDWHVEEPVEAEKVNNMNEYSLDIADSRIERLTQGFLWMLEMHRSKFQIQNAILWLGGDFFSGYIHEELEESNALSPVESILWLQERLVRVINRILDEGKLERLVIPCSYGNHGRTGHKKRISTGAENSYEWMMYQQLTQWYADDPRVEVIAPKSQLIYIDVYDFTIRFAHGDQIGYGGGVGGVFIPFNKKIFNWNSGHHAHVTCIGHFHQYLSLPYAVINGSLIGFSPYAVNIGAKFEPPQQSYFLIDSKRGKTGSYPIWVDEK